MRATLLVALVATLSGGVCGAVDQNDVAVSLPPGVHAVWDIDKAQRDTTPTRERICLNGLWRWQPADTSVGEVPRANWGYFKVPGCWPGITDYMQKDSQRLFAHPSWRDQKFGGISAAWYERVFRVPAGWGGRRITLAAEYLNSYAAVFIDANRAGELRFPAGELDITSVCAPGSEHKLTLHVIAMPLKAVALSYTDSASARELKGAVPRRGLCGDVYLCSEPRAERITDTRIDTSVRRGEVTVHLQCENVRTDARYIFRVRILDGTRVAKEFTTSASGARDFRDGRIAITEKWLPEKLWDIHTPQNRFHLEVSLLDAEGKLLDNYWRAEFGFRELWIAGRDFFLNGTRIHLRAVPLDNAQISAGLSTYSAACETLERLKSIGINFVYTHNYDCEPGSHLSFAEILRAADDVGMLVALTQPHFSHYDWKADDADRNNGYAGHAAFYVGVAKNHPAVVMYAMSHNATGYEEDMNPDMIDGLHDPRDTWSARNAKVALRAEAIVRAIDPSRIVYHHASGNLGSMHVMNFYPNFVPIQELSDWFEHWSSAGVKPAFMCEYGAPFTWDWTMYRGWFKGEREFGSAKVPWEFCLAEWNAQFLGDRAYAISEAEKANLRWEAKQFRAGNLWHRWDYPNEVGSSRFTERYPVFAMYLKDNWRAFRAWGVSAVSPWEYGHFWKLRENVDKGRKELVVDWEHLQRPGFSPDYIDGRLERIDLAFESADWIATPAADALLRNNRALLGYIGGRSEHVTSKDHNFFAGEECEKQIVVINDSREEVACAIDWQWNFAQPISGREMIQIAPGEQKRVRVKVSIPAGSPPGHYVFSARFHFGTGEQETDECALDILPRVATAVPTRNARIALFDPQGETRALLARLGVSVQNVGPDADLSRDDMLIIGKAALTVRKQMPDIRRIRDGLKVLMFEQTAEALEKRLGFRVQEYGLRTVFPRIRDHPVFTQLFPTAFSDWRGAATLLPPRLRYELRPRLGPTVEWCGLRVPHLWRCGNAGSVASVMIEKPARGDFLSLIDGGYALQYSTLLEYREGSGVMLLCQMDVTGRSENDPAAEILVRNLLTYLEGWKAIPRKTAVYEGEDNGRHYLVAAGIALRDRKDGKLSTNDVVLAGPGAGKTLRDSAGDFVKWLNDGGHLLAIGLDQTDVETLLPGKLSLKRAEHINAFFESPGFGTLLQGVGPGDVHNRDPRDLPLVIDGAHSVGDGVLAIGEKQHTIFCQLAPWQFEGNGQMNLKRTQRRAAVLVNRLLANLGVAAETPLLERFAKPVAESDTEKRWLSGFYLDQPEEWDDPYRFFRW